MAFGSTNTKVMFLLEKASSNPKMDLMTRGVVLRADAAEMLSLPLFQRPHHGQIVLRIARAEIEALGEVELIVAVLEAQTLVERLEILV